MSPWHQELCVCVGGRNHRRVHISCFCSRLSDARGAGAFSTLLLVGALLLIAGFIVARKATRSAESEPLLATTA